MLLRFFLSLVNSFSERSIQVETLPVPFFNQSEISKYLKVATSSHWHAGAYARDCDLSNTRWLLRESVLNVLTLTQRHIFLAVTIFLLLISIFGNFAAVFVAFRMKHRTMYKHCLVSLAISDILFTVVTSTNNIYRYSQPMVNWALGDFMCSVIPMVQTMCVLSNSMTLTCVAVDRYQSVMNALRGRWDPSLVVSVTCMIAIWISAAGVSTPTIFIYNSNAVNIIDVDGYDIIACEELDFCMSDRKSTTHTYFTIVFTMIFFPLLCTFLGLHGIIAAHIWKRRKPISAPTLEPPSGKTQSSDVGASSPETSRDKTSTRKKVEPPRFIFKDNSNVGWVKHADNTSEPSANGRANETKRTVHMARKLRTFRIIIAVMLMFFVCRLPSWIYLLIVSSKSMVGSTSEGWIMHYSFSTMGIANSASNPFLYGFLNEFLNMVTDFCSWYTGLFGCDCSATAMCCRCQSFAGDSSKGNGSGVGICNPDEVARPGMASAMVPRSAYSAEEKQMRENLPNCEDMQNAKNEVQYGGVYPF